MRPGHVTCIALFEICTLGHNINHAWHDLQIEQGVESYLLKQAPLLQLGSRVQSHSR